MQSSAPDRLSSAVHANININPIPVEVEVLEDSEPCTDSGNEARKKFEDVEREYGEHVKQAEFNLQFIVKTIYTPDLEMSPWEHFGMKQSCLAGVGMLSRIRYKKLTCTDLRDQMENLACLVDLTSQHNQKYSGYLAYLLANFSQALGKLGELLEDFSLKRVTDWAKIGEYYLEIYRESLMLPKIPEPFPKLQDFTEANLIAQGMFTTTHCAKFLEEPVIVKVAFKKKNPANPKRSSRNRKFILNSTQIACIVKHPVFARVFSTFSSDEAYICVEEYHRGMDISKILATSRTFPTTFSMIIVAQLCLALEYLHYVGFIHRNLMPSNIVITPQCRIKVVDFTNAKICSGIYSVRFLSGFRRRTASEFNDRETEGELAFQAPELVKRVSYGRAVDWWSLGVTAYEIRFGKLPFRANTENDQRQKILKAHVEYPESDSKDAQFNDYVAFVKLLLKKNPKTRMCSRGYDQYRKQDLYKNLSWKTIESRKSYMDFPPIAKLMTNNEIPAFVPPADQPVDPAIIMSLSDLKEATEQYPLYVFCSEPMRNALTKRNEKASLEMADELIVPFEDAPYKFKEIYKATRIN